MTTLHANESAQLQIGDAHRACLTALCCLRLVAGDATDATLQSEVSRLHAGLCSIADELAELGQRARLSAGSS